MDKPFRDFISYAIGFVCFITFVVYGEDILNNKALLLVIFFVLVIFFWRAYFRILWIKHCSMRMTKKLKVLWTGIAIIILMSIFPPWKNSLRTGFYGFLFDPPRGAQSIDVALLGVQIFIVALIIAGVIASIKEK